MCSPISLIANLFMDEFKVKALSSAQYMLRYMDATFVIQDAKHSQQLLQHISSHDPHKLFTIEQPNQKGALPFLETLFSPGPNNTLVTTIYRKPLHTDQYLHWDSNHIITTKNSVCNTLAFRAKVI